MPEAPAPRAGPTAVGSKTEEVRIATTMTGGVSLAVWTGGVTRELDLLQQASLSRRALQGEPTSPDARRPAPPQPEAGSAGEVRELYGRLLHLLDVVVEIDVLCGTSAGGINAVFLAYARARRKGLAKLRDMWLTLGALLDLLRDPTDATVPSLLRGDETLFEEVERQLGELDATGGTEVDAKEIGPSTTLYVTTTLLSPERRPFLDALGTRLDVADQHGRFTFTEKDIRDEGIEPALALAARSSASFPVAFEPSFVPVRTPTTRRGDVLARPAMGRFADFARDHWVADGGLLDNQPLDVVLERVFDRRARRPVRRVLLFVVPTAGPTGETAPVDDIDAPAGLLPGLLSSLEASTSQSISADLGAVVEHNDRIDVRSDLRLHLARSAEPLDGDRRLLTLDLLRAYRRREIESGTRALSAALLRKSAARSEATSIRTALGCRWEAAPQLPITLDGLAAYGRGALDDAKSIALEVLRLAREATTSPATRALLSAAKEDVHRSAGVETRETAGALAASVTESPDPRADLVTAWNAANEVSGSSWEGLAMALWGVGAPIDYIAESAPPGPLRDYARYLGLPAPEPLLLATALFDLAVAERALSPVDAGQYQRLELVQLSADTASQLAPGRTTAARKLTGLQLHHFGAFYKRSWRANDWMWGRLDAAGWLVQVLLDPRRLRSAKAGVAEGARVEAVLTALEGFEPRPPAPVLRDVEKELSYLDDPNLDPPASLPTTARWIARAWQRSIAAEELANLAGVVLGESTSTEPGSTARWAREVLKEGADLGALLDACPVADETVAAERGSPLMVRTLAKTAAVSTAALSSVRQVPAVVRPAVVTAHTVALGGYRVAETVKAVPRNLVLAGLALLVVGIAAAVQSSDLFGLPGLVATALGGYLVTFGAWQISSRLVAALVAVTVVLVVGSLATPVVRAFLFGASPADGGYVGRHVYWLGADWWHPLLAFGVLVALVAALTALTRRPVRPRPGKSAGAAPPGG